MAAPSIVVLGRDWCDDTIRSRAWMDARGIAYRYVNVDVDPAGDARIRALNDGRVTTPTILLGDEADPARVLVEPSDEALAAAIDEATAAA